MNIAIFSPNQNPYSETFIQAHKHHLKGNVYYYYGRCGVIQLESSKQLVSNAYNYLLRVQRLLFGYTYRWVNEKAILKSLQKNKVDVILVEYGTHAFNLESLITRSKKPFIVHFHGYDASVKQVINSCNSYKSIFEKASKVVAVSKVMYAQLISLGCPQDKLIHNVYGPNDHFLEIEPQFKKPQFMAVGRFTDKKAPYLTIMAFKQVLDKYAEAKLIMAGDGVLINTCKNLVKQFKIEQGVTFVGVITPQQFQEYLKESLAFVQHSITADNGDMEGTPVAILEASAAGLPVIATKHAGIPDVIVHGETGLLCQEHDVDTMAQHMLQFLENNNLPKTMGANGKANIKQHFSMHRHIQTLQTILESVVTL